MKRPSTFRVSAFALTMALVGAGCGGSDLDAATVNGRGITRSELTDELDGLISAAKDPAANLEAADRQQLLSQLTVGEAQTTPKASTAADLLTNKVINSLVAQAMIDFKLTREAEDIAASEADIAQSLYNFTPQKVKDAAILDGANTSRLSRYLTDPSTKWFTDADIDDYYQRNKATEFAKGQACSAHILVADEALAARLLAEIKGGADFTKVAADNSTDDSNKAKGGDLGCNVEGAFVPEFEAAIKQAKAGDIVGPVKTQFGFHVIKVVSTYAVPAYDTALKAQIAAKLASPVGWLQATIARAKITVNSRYGTWDPQARRVVPPEGAASGPQAGSDSGASGK